MIARLALVVFRLALLSYPQAFRARYGTEMENDFVSRLRLAADTRGTMAAIAFWLRSVFSTVPSALRVRANARRNEHLGDRRSATREAGEEKLQSALCTRTGSRRPPAWNHITQDFRYCLRTFARKPLFTTAVVLTVALGIGANTATFSVVNGVLLRPLVGAEDPDELLQIYRHWPGAEYGSSSIPHYQDVRDRSGDAFENVAAWVFSPLSITSGDRSERAMGMLVSANFFQTYGVVPMLGRPFLPGEEDVGPGEHPVTVVSHAFWESSLGADMSVIGKTVSINGRSFEVVGVAPPDFRGPVNAVRVPVYVPIMMQRDIAPAFDWIEARGPSMLRVVGRLHDGVSVERATSVLEATLAQLREEFPAFYRGDIGVTVVPDREAGMHPTLTGQQMEMGTVVLAVVSILLLIACVNVANLLLARANERRREIGVRASLGAGRWRIFQQLLTESLILSMLAGFVAIGLAYLASNLIGLVRIPSLGPYGNLAVEIDSRVLVFTLGVSVVAGLVFGLVPALRAASPNIVDAVKGASSERNVPLRFGSGLVVVQMALSVLLLVGSGLFLRNLQGAMTINPGFAEPSHLVVASMDPGLQGYDAARAREFFDRLVEETTALPGVETAGMVNGLPLTVDVNYSGVDVPGYEFAEGESSAVEFALVTEGYLEAMGVPLLEGRLFNRQDDTDAPPVIVVNRAFAERFWPGESPVGKTVTASSRQREVIGVVETGKYHSLGESAMEFMFLPHREGTWFAMTLVARTSADAVGTLGRIREVTRRLDPNMPLYDVRTMEDHVGLALLPARLNVYVLGAFAVLGLFLAAVGIYGVLAHSVARRTREIGIRTALGADKTTIQRLVLGEGMRLALVGTGLGLLGAVGASRFVKSVLYGVNALDPVAFGVVPMILLGVATVAVFLPARRAASVEPVTALKTE